MTLIMTDDVKEATQDIITSLDELVRVCTAVRDIDDVKMIDAEKIGTVAYTKYVDELVLGIVQHLGIIVENSQLIADFREQDERLKDFVD